MPSISQHGTLVADTVTTVTLTGDKLFRGWRVQHWGTTSSAPIFWSWGLTDATTPTPTTAGADDTYRLPGGSPPDYTDDDSRSSLVVKLICADAVGYSVESW